ncbi:MAG TPA: 16S rRNA (cytosine(1402)-N(4))-methyltransferase RsmH [Blastocatellia bacterium]|nr:16S rRNA (cytosine(1402)-N(4))-methyltransferase RsmH [Blastocatellia bacterium]
MSIEEAESWQTHTPVLLEEVTRWLRPERGGTFVDCTLGPGGHAQALLEASPDTRVIGIDRDADALERARRRLARFEERFEAVHANFKDLAAVMSLVGVTEAEGILADLGVSSLQIDTEERGFSFAVDAPLDMRMDRSQKETAADLIARLTERELADLIFEYGEERGARKVARAIVRERSRHPITTTRQLAGIVVGALKVPGRWRIHPATRTFQAIRIAVNDELAALRSFIPEAFSYLARGGRLAIISFHSLEDRIVKQGFQRESGRCICPPEIRTAVRNVEPAVCNYCGARKRVEVLTRKPVRPSREEIERNPRSRSARLRVCERL